ncbi:MAG: ABC transporter permease [Bauldia litoralis]
MIRIAASRLATSLIALLGAALFAFIALRVAPGDAARLVLGPFATDEAVQALRVKMGLDDPLPVQFWHYLTSFVSGDWGWSYSLGQSVRDLLGERFPATLELGLYAFLFALVAAVSLAVIGAFRRGLLSDGVPRALSVFALAVPQFWFGIVALIVGFEMLGLFPGPSGRLPPGVTAPAGPTGLYTIDALLAGDLATFVTALHYLALPAITLGLLPFGFLLRLLRANLLDVAGEPFVLVARAQGQSHFRVFLRYVLPNAIIPTLMASGLILGQLLAGSVLVERVFNWPGAGSLVTQGLLQQDYSVVQTFILLSAFIYILANLFVDLLAAAIDPRIARGAGQ